MSKLNLDAATIRQAAQGRWHSILAGLSICVPTNPRQHAPCPTCGGRDRFRFDNQNGNGTFFCSQCTQKSGDGFRLVMNVRGCRFPEALRCVAESLGLTPTTRAELARPLPPIPPRVDRRALAFKFELAGLDLRLRAGRIRETATNITIDNLTAEELDHGLGLVAQGYADVARAELFEQVADGLKYKDFLERKKLDEKHRAA